MAKITLPHDHGANRNMEKALAKLPDEAACARTAELFKQAGDGTRLRILWLLCHCETCVGNIAAAMQMSDPAVSHHLRLLKKSGLVVSRREGKETYYRLSDTDKAALFHRVIEEMFEISCPLAK